MSNVPKKVVAVYFDLPNYINPKEVRKAFRLFNERSELKDGSFEHIEKTEELRLLLDVMTAKSDRYTYAVDYWNQRCGENKVTVLQILEIVDVSLFEKSQESLWQS